MEGFIFQVPDFDDAALKSDQINFADPNGFYAEFNKRFPGQWGAVSWEYASIMDLWRSAAEKAGSAAPDAVVAAMKDGGNGAHAFGDAKWWGSELFGIDNALEFRNIPAWYEKHGDLLVKHMKAYDQMWDQRG